MRHIISATVTNKIGVLARIIGLFSARGFNIDSLAVGETENPQLSRMTIVVNGDDAILEQVRKQLGKIIDVIKVSDLTCEQHVERDFMLLKVNVPVDKRSEIVEIINIFRGKIIDVGKKDMIVEISGPEDRIQAILDLMRPYGIKEIARTGGIAMKRGNK